MYDDLLRDVVGDERWRRNAPGVLRRGDMRWAESRPLTVLVHGDFTEDNIVVDPDGSSPYLVDFERVGHRPRRTTTLPASGSTRERPDGVASWRLLERYLGHVAWGRSGSAAEWGIRVQHSCTWRMRRLRFATRPVRRRSRPSSRARQPRALLDAALDGRGRAVPRSERSERTVSGTRHGPPRLGLLHGAASRRSQLRVSPDDGTDAVNALRCAERLRPQEKPGT